MTDDVRLLDLKRCVRLTEKRNYGDSRDRGVDLQKKEGVHRSSDGGY